MSLAEQLFEALQYVTKSSANSRLPHNLDDSGKSEIIIRHSNGLRTEPCGTLTFWEVFPFTSSLAILNKIASCHVESYTLQRSRKMAYMLEHAVVHEVFTHR
ncbi:hypothetical protein OUZ56_016808 [Daphnia magna]|uniref:GMP synthase n=1 Tax=Daphnia magna TaxID=35525 RepID=A0ABR0ARN3_9CRUS|nr:hypothetical protein OUZ56_016808 [Daphnia magna]